MLSDELTAALQHAVQPQPFEPDYTEALTRSRRMRARRRWTSAAAATLAVAGIAFGVVAAIPTQGDQPSVVTPAISPRPVLASVNGVDVTWLPTGMHPLPYDPNEGGMAGVGVDAVQLSFLAQGEGGRMSLAVQRGYEINVDKFAKNEVATGGSIRRITVRGHPALFLATTEGTGELLWAEQSGLTIGVFGPGLALPDLMQVANGLVIHPAPKPAGNPAVAVSLIETAFQQAYTGTGSAATKLAAIENGDKLASVLSEITRQIPETVRTTKITTGTVTFLDPTHALVANTRTFQYQGSPVQESGPGTAVLINGAWKVSETTYCGSIQRPGVTLTCPPK